MSLSLRFSGLDQPLTDAQSHGPITGYEVTLWTPKGNESHRETTPPETSSFSFNLTDVAAAFSNDSELEATVVASNAAGHSAPSHLLIPLHFTSVYSWNYFND